MHAPRPAAHAALCALGLLALCALSACPAQDSGSAGKQPVESGAAPPASGDAAGEAAASPPEMYPEAWPLAAVTLPEGATPAALPDSVAKAYMEPGVLTADGSGMHKALADMHTDYWYLGFESALGAGELLAHFDACAKAAGLEADKSNSAAPGLSANYAAPDGSSGLSIQPMADATGVVQPGRYFIFLQQGRAE